MMQQNNTNLNKKTVSGNGFLKEGKVSKNSKDFETSKVLELGPLEQVFPCSESKILDFLVAFQDYDYSISDIANNSGVGFKTTLGIIRKLESQSVINHTRNVGRSLMYRLNMNSNQAQSISKLALDIATKRIKESAK